jgi:hypothetical protein
MVFPDASLPIWLPLQVLACGCDISVVPSAVVTRPALSAGAELQV